MMRLLNWIGGRSPWWLAAFSIIALALPAFSSLLRPALPAFFVLLLALAIARMDPLAVAARLASPRHVLRLLALTALLLPLSAGIAALLSARYQRLALGHAADVLGRTAHIDRRRVVPDTRL